MGLVCSRSVFFLMLLLLGSLAAFAQGAQISGIVTDPTSAVVPNAEVVIVNQATQVERRVQTNEAGYFTAPFLDVGTYVLRVSASGC
jgi:hypothetical protein